MSIKQQHVAQGLSVNSQLVSSMKLYYQSVCQLVFLSFCCFLITVRESYSTFVPGRCLCHEMVPGVRGQLNDLTVFPISPRCNRVTVIVTLKSNEKVCLNPEGAMGKQLIRCWERVHKMGRNTKVCLRRRKRRNGQRRSRVRNRKVQ